MAEINSLKNTDANNTERFNGAKNVSELDNAGQALEGMLSRFFKDNDGTNTTTGSDTAYVLAGNRTGVTENKDVRTCLVRFHVENDGAATFQFNSLPALPLRKRGNAELEAGDINTNDICLVVYNPAWNAYQVIGI